MPNYVVQLILGIWLLGVTVALYKLFLFFKNLTKGVGVPDLKKVLEKILAEQRISQKDINELSKRISFLESDSLNHVQKIALVRFNPFKELGGDHSFCLAILDAHSSGVVITGLHTRERTRVYMKAIKKGKPERELSEEEKKAFEEAQRK